MTQPNAKNIDELLNELQAVAENSAIEYRLQAKTADGRFIVAFVNLIRALRMCREQRNAQCNDNYHPSAHAQTVVEEYDAELAEILQGKGGEG